MDGLTHVEKIWNLLLTAFMVACISWTITQEEIFRDFRVWADRTAKGRGWVIRKLLYLPTCHYCLSHWVAAWCVWMANWSWVYVFPIIWIANHSITLYGLLRQQQKRCSFEAQELEIRCRRHQ